MFSQTQGSSDFNFSTSTGTALADLQTTATTLAPTALVDSLQQSNWMQASALSSSTVNTFDAHPASLTADAADNTLSTARNLGVVNGSATVRDFVGSGDPNDFYNFQLTASSNVSLRLIGLSADADLYFIQDANQNGVVDRGEVLSYSIASGSNPEAIDLAGLAAGSYAVQVLQYQGDTNYQLSITATPSGAGSTLGTAANFGILNGRRSTNEFAAIRTRKRSIGFN